MRNPFLRIGTLGALACGFLLVASTARAQVKPATTSARPEGRRPGEKITTAEENRESSVHTLEIYNGPFRTVRYFPNNASRAELDSLRNLDAAENQLNLAHQLMDLRRQYVHDERLLQAQRLTMQEKLYAAASSTAAPQPSLQTFQLNYPAFPDFPALNATVGSPAPVVAGVPAVSVLTSTPYGAGMGAMGATAAGVTIPQGVGPVAAGFGDEGVIKAEIARTLAQQATPEFLSQATRTYNTALAAAERFDDLRAALNGPSSGIRTAAAVDETPVRVTVTMKGGQKVDGTLVRDEGDRIVVATNDGEMDITKSETASILKHPEQKKKK